MNDNIRGRAHQESTLEHRAHSNNVFATCAALPFLSVLLSKKKNLIFNIGPYRFVLLQHNIRKVLDMKIFTTNLFEGKDCFMNLSCRYIRMKSINGWKAKHILKEIEICWWKLNHFKSTHSKSDKKYIRWIESTETRPQCVNFCRLQGLTFVLLICLERNLLSRDLFIKHESLKFVLISLDLFILEKSFQVKEFFRYYVTLISFKHEFYKLPTHPHIVWALVSLCKLFFFLP